MNIFNSPVAKRTRLQRELFYQGLYETKSGFSGSSRKKARKQNRVTGSPQCDVKQESNEVIDVDDRSIKNKGSEITTKYDPSIKVEDLSSTNEPKKEESDEKESSHNSSEESEGVKEINNNKIAENDNTFKTGRHTYFLYSSDDSASDTDTDTDVIHVKQEVDEDLELSCKFHQESQSNTKAASFQSIEDDEDDSFKSTENESINRLDETVFSLVDENESINRLDKTVFSLVDKILNQPTTTKQSPINNKKEMDQNTMDETDSSDIDVYEKTNEVNDCYMEVSESKEAGNESNDAEESHSSSEESDGVEEIDKNEFMMRFKDNGSPIDVYSLDDSYSNEQNNTEADSFQSTEDESFSESESETESESDDLDDFDFSPRNKKPKEPTSKKKYCMKDKTEKVLYGSSDEQEKNRSVQKAKMEKKWVDESCDEKENVKNKVNDVKNQDKNHSVQKAKMEEKTVDESCDEKENTKNKANDVKNREFKKERRKLENGSVDAILDPIINNEEGVHGNYCLPLKFRFDDSEDEVSSEENDKLDVENLFQEMNFGFECEEIGSYRTQTEKNQDEDDCNDDIDLCQKGEHVDIYLEEQWGLRCRLCGAILLESKFVIPKLANYAPDKSRRSHVIDEQQFSSYGNPYYESLERNFFDNICNQTEGTVWEFIPTNIRANMYPHQQEGFKFLWENLAGTIEISRLQKHGPRGGDSGGGCIISHAPGTGKTLLTIVFIESFLKKFPKCCPVIVAPASMLLTWEAEFKKWQVGFSFINLNNSEFLKNEMINIGSSRNKKDLVRAIKISSWSNGGSVLGVSYSLYEKLTRNTENTNLVKMGKVLITMPNLVVLDEGHTPRNQNSNIWNTLLKLITKNRVILSGTPFQNNFRELLNSLRLVRPATANDILKEKIFADMLQRKNMNNNSRNTSTGDVEKLKVIISPFVHVHKGHILESKLPGLKQCVILLNPLPLQKGFIENLGNLATTFEYEHKVALVSVHPSLILYCSLSEKEEKSTNKQQLEKVRLHPNVGVKTRFVMELIRLGVSLHEKVLIFSQYIQPLELLKDQIANAFGWDVGKEVMVIKGKMHQKLRQTFINDFNDPKSEMKVLLASTKCCSEGIHLYGASRVVLLDVVWNPSVERQAISRAYRLGQKKVVYTYHLMTAGTTEEDKYDRQVEKGRLAEMVFSSASMNDGDVKKKVNVDDKILQQMVDHQEMKILFKKIRYPQNQTRI